MQIMAWTWPSLSAPRWARLHRQALVDASIGVAVFAVALALYNATLTPSLTYVSPDANELATLPYQLGLLHPSGYPLYTWLGKLFTYLPAGDVAHRMNLLSAAGAAGSAALVYGIVRLLSGHRVAALFAAAALALSTTLWSQAVISEVYAPNAFMVALTLFLAVAWAAHERRRGLPLEEDLPSALLFFALCLAYGLSLGAHLSNLAFAPALGLFVLLVNWRIIARPRVVIIGAALLIVGGMQFLWLPVKAATLNDPLSMRIGPDSLEGFRSYTVDAFEQLRFAFPWEAIPDRIVLYLGFVRDNFGWWGLALALVGMWEMLRLRTEAFYLLMLAYIVQVGFFVQYRAFDIEVFFIPAHLILAVFAGFGAWRLFHYVGWLADRARTRVRPAPAVAAGLVSLALVVPLAVELPGNWSANDRSDYTVVNDFYEQVFETVERDSVLVGQSGVFGYDMFYFREVYDRRPDVLMPLLENPNPGVPLPEGATIYTVGRPLEGMRRVPWDPPAGLVSEDLWYVPVLACPSAPMSDLRLQKSLVLYRLSEEPPTVVTTMADLQHLVGADLGGIELVGYDLAQDSVERGGTLHLTLYWRAKEVAMYMVATQLGESDYREEHWLTFGNVTRYIEEFGWPRGGILVEEYDRVVLSSTPTGPQPLTVSIQRQQQGGLQETGSVTLAEILVTE